MLRGKGRFAGMPSSKLRKTQPFSNSIHCPSRVWAIAVTFAPCSRTPIAAYALPGPALRLAPYCELTVARLSSTVGTAVGEGIGVCVGTGVGVSGTFVGVNVGIAGTAVAVGIAVTATSSGVSWPPRPRQPPSNRTMRHSVSRTVDWRCLLLIFIDNLPRGGPRRLKFTYEARTHHRSMQRERPFAFNALRSLCRYRFRGLPSIS